MTTIHATPLSLENFTVFGSYANLTNPSGPSLGGKYHTFFRDMLVFPTGTTPMGFSSLQVKKNDNFLMEGMEYHDTTNEVMLPLDDDAILCVAPANGGNLQPEEVKAFLVPKGTAVRLNTGVWHDVMYPVHNPVVNVLICLPERLYKNDLTVQSLPQGGITILPAQSIK